MLQLRIYACALMLALGSYFDWKTREVSDKLWLSFSTIGVAFTVYELFFSQDPLKMFGYLISFLLTLAVSLGLYYFGFFGGADAKALISISLLLPYHFPAISFHPLAPIIVLTNSALATIMLPIAFAVLNLSRMMRGEEIYEGLESEPLRRKVAAFFLGYRTKRGGKFLFSLEKEVDGKRTFDLSLLREQQTFTEDVDVWVTPGIPLLIFMLIGFIIMMVFGDLLAFFYRLFL